MIEYKTGDILNEDVEALVNTVNCVGVMGRGVALQFKKKYAENFNAYLVACKNKEVHPGKMFIFETGMMVNPRYIINFPTKLHWREKSRMEYIEDGLIELVNAIRSYGIHSIAIPPLGSGLGGLDWKQVKSHIELKLQPLEDVRIVIYESSNFQIKKTSYNNKKEPSMTPGRAALIKLINSYLNALLDPFVTLLEVHKLMYFMQEAGEPLSLKFEKAYYGPFATNLTHVLGIIEGYYIRGYTKNGDKPDEKIELMPCAIDNASKFIASKGDETSVRIKRVAELVEGFETPFGLELLSTVHWVMKNNDAASLENIIREVYAWNDRKKQQFTERQISLSVDILRKREWI